MLYIYLFTEWCCNEIGVSSYGDLCFVYKWDTLEGYILLLLSEQSMKLLNCAKNYYPISVTV